MSIERISVIVGIVVGIITALFAVTNNWDKVERAAELAYPLPLIVLLVLALLGMTALYFRERRRTTPKTMREASAEQKERREQWKVDARRTITLILNEVASNRRLAQRSVTGTGLTRTFKTENWVAHRHALAELPDAGKAFELTSEAYDAFADLAAADQRGRPWDFGKAAKAGSAAEKELKALLASIEGPRTRWAVSGVGGEE